MSRTKELLDEQSPQPPGFRRTVLSCAWCPGGDRVELGDYRTSWLTALNPYTGRQARIHETLPEPPAHVVSDWLERHAECEARALAGRVRTVVVDPQR